MDFAIHIIEHNTTDRELKFSIDGEPGQKMLAVVRACQNFPSSECSGWSGRAEVPLPDLSGVGPVTGFSLTLEFPAAP